jgi:hypothetical protein
MLAETIARLKGKASGLRLVEGLMELAALKGPPPRHQQPAAYVIPLAEAAAPNELCGRHRQAVTVEIAVVLVVSADRADASTEERAEALAIVRRQVFAALLGWQPTPDHAPFDFTDGSLLGIGDGAVRWQDGFSTDFQLEGEA